MFSALSASFERLASIEPVRADVSKDLIQRGYRIKVERVDGRPVDSDKKHFVDRRLATVISFNLRVFSPFVGGEGMAD